MELTAPVISIRPQLWWVALLMVSYLWAFLVYTFQMTWWNCPTCQKILTGKDSLLGDMGARGGCVIVVYILLIGYAIQNGKSWMKKATIFWGRFMIVYVSRDYFKYPISIVGISPKRYRGVWRAGKRGDRASAPSLTLHKVRVVMLCSSERKQSPLDCEEEELGEEIALAVPGLYLYCCSPSILNKTIMIQSYKGVTRPMS